MRGPERQQAAVAEVIQGNVPGFLRRFVPVSPRTPEHRHVTYFVLPDYLAIGTDDDFLRIPLTMPSVTALVTKFDVLPPTPLMVDQIYTAATVHLAPIPLRPGPKMRSSEFYLRHQNLIQAQRTDWDLGELTAGHKKDVVLSRRLSSANERIAIYGWHRRQDDPIQPLSTVHGARYADYSHGLRLIWPDVWIDNVRMRLADVLRSPDTSPMLTKEGFIAPRRLLRLTAPVSGARPLAPCSLPD